MSCITAVQVTSFEIEPVRNKVSCADTGSLLARFALPKPPRYKVLSPLYDGDGGSWDSEERSLHVQGGLEERTEILYRHRELAHRGSLGWKRLETFFVAGV
jgi:hypothetical protein